MVFCTRAWRRGLRCSGARSLFVDLCFVLIFVFLCSLVASHLHSSNTTALVDHVELPTPNERLPELVAPPNNGDVGEPEIVEMGNAPRAKKLAMPFRGRMIVARARASLKQEVDDRVANEGDQMKRLDVGSKNIDGVPYPLLNSAGSFVPIRRIVHLDLKGGPFKPFFFSSVFGTLKSLRATGVMIEWEDMFPYSKRLASATNGNAYSMKEVESILASAREHGLEVIPLVQTFGHLEWILKLEQFAHLRESSAYPQVICFALEEAWDLIREMIDDVIAVHSKFDLKSFHMGADEVFQFGYCNSSMSAIQKHGSKERAMIWHLARTAQYIHDKHPGISVLAWHDMIVQAVEEDMKFYKLVDLVEPVLWSYAEDLEQYLSPATWYALKPFKKVWGSSAYKGADGPMRFSSNPVHYIRNNEAWVSQLTANYHEFEYIQGMVLAGWSRYDHMAILCELFPVGLPSLAMSLETLISGRKMAGDYPFTTSLFKCKLTTDQGFVFGCLFPGQKIYELVNELRDQHKQVQTYLEGDFEFNGWLSPVAQEYRMSSGMYVEKVLHFVDFYLAPLERLERDLREEMSTIYFNDTIEEFIFTYMENDLRILRERRLAGLAILETRNFPKRPFVRPAKTPATFATQKPNEGAVARTL